jgi:hypothetical protein
MILKTSGTNKSTLDILKKMGIEQFRLLSDYMMKQMQQQGRRNMFV